MGQGFAIRLLREVWVAGLESGGCFYRLSFLIGGWVGILIRWSKGFQALSAIRPGDANFALGFHVPRVSL